MQTCPQFFASATSQRLPVLIDTDIGTNVDDLLALLCVLGSFNLDLVGVTTVYGDTRLRAHIAAATLLLASRGDIAVGYGAAIPLSGDEIFWTGHEADGYDLQNTVAPSTTAAEVFNQAMDNHGSELVVIGLGPLTNIATLLDNCARPPRCVLAMAGQFSDGAPDHNVASDAVAASKLTQRGIPVIFVGIELCRTVAFSPADLAALHRANPDHPLTSLVTQRTRAWWRYLDQDFSNPCDALTILALTNPEIFEFQQVEVDFRPAGTQRGTTHWAPSTRSPHWFASAVHAQQAQTLIVDRLIEGISAATLAH